MKSQKYTQGPAKFGGNFSTVASNVVSSGTGFGSKTAVKNVKNVPLTKPAKTKARGFSARGK